MLDVEINKDIRRWGLFSKDLLMNIQNIEFEIKQKDSWKQLCKL